MSWDYARMSCAVSEGLEKKKSPSRAYYSFFFFFMSCGSVICTRGTDTESSVAIRLCYKLLREIKRNEITPDHCY